MYRHATLCGLIVRKINPITHATLFNTCLKMSTVRSLAVCVCSNHRPSYRQKWGYSSKVIPQAFVGNQLNQSQFVRCSGTFPDRNKNLVKNSTRTVPPSINKSSLPQSLNDEGSQSLSVNVPARVPQISELLVNKCPPHVQPYLKLMRIDRPIGMFHFHALFAVNPLVLYFIVLGIFQERGYCTGLVVGALQWVHQRAAFLI